MGEDGERHSAALDRRQQDAGGDSPIELRFAHRLRFTNDVFAPDNPTLVDVCRTANDASRSPARLLAFADAGLLAARPNLTKEYERYVAAHAADLRPMGPLCEVEGGEHCKNDPALLRSVLKAIDGAGLCRQSYVVAIGGGAMLDLVGFAAAVAHRGMRLVRLPTTTLSQCDSGVGVKNGVNLFGKKNYLGSFSVPWAVINDEGFLATLSTRDWRAGFSETVKVALIKDRALFERIVGATGSIRNRKLEVSAPILRRSAELHMAHIAEGGDPFELTTARPLDFGHWSAHKLEQMTEFRLRHGEAVAIGLAIDLVYGAMVGLTRWPAAAIVLRCLRGMGFDLYHQAMRNTDVLLDGLEEFRQHLGGELTLTMIEDAGRPIDVHAIDAARLRCAIEYLAERPATDLWPAPRPS